MAEATQPELRASKRKRAQVNYYEEPISDEEVPDFPEGEEENDVQKPSRAKVRSLKPCRHAIH
jgi:hypothetical protein